MLRIDGPTVNSTNLELVSKTQLKTYLSLSTAASADDSLMQSILDAVHRIIYRTTGNRIFKDLQSSPGSAADYDYLLDGRGGYVLKLPQWPIVGITSIELGYIDGSDPDTDWQTTYTFGSGDYYANAETGRLHGIRRGWPVIYNGIRVVWSAGYTTLPADLVEAALQFASVAFKRAKDARWDQLSIGKDAETTVYLQQAMTNDVRRVLLDYTPSGVGIG